MKTCARSRFLALGAAFAVVSACTAPGTDAQSTARAFVDAHYVRIDLETSRSLCGGLAREKVEKEIALTQGNPIGDDTRRPRVSYTLQEAHEGQERSQFAFDLEVHPGGAESFRKLVLVALRKEAGGWVVSNYNESDPPNA